MIYVLRPLGPLQYVYLVDTDIELYTDTGMEDSNEIKQSQLNNEGLENMAVQYTGNTELSNNELVARQIT